MENNEFPNGFDLPLSEKVNGEFRKKGLFNLLGLSKDRIHELQKEVHIAVIKFSDKNNGTSMPEAIQYLAKLAKTAPEFAFVMYDLGAIAERATTRNRMMGGLGGLLLGGIMQTPKKESSDTGEEPDIEELIRRSKRINRDRKDEDEEEGE